MIPDNAVEYALIAAGVLFFGYSWHTLSEAKKDATANAILKVNGARQIMSAVGVDVGWINLICSGLVCISAAATLAFPPPPPVYTQIPQSLTLIVVLILICLLLSLESQIMKTARRRIDAQTPMSHQATIAITASPDDQSSSALTALTARAVEDTNRDKADVVRATADGVRALSDEARDRADIKRQGDTDRRVEGKAPKVKIDLPSVINAAEETAAAAKDVADAAVESATAAKTVARVARVVADAEADKDK